jgi:hypothetical protein
MRNSDARRDHNALAKRAPITGARSLFPVESPHEIAARRAFDEVRRLADQRKPPDPDPDDD